MKTFILVIVFAVDKCFCINGIIWDKKTKSFLPIFSNKQFKVLQDKRFHDSRRFEEHKFAGDEVKFVYYEEQDIFEFYDSDRKVTGICGDIWTILSEYLNFTMVLKKSSVRTIGTQLTSNQNFTGLLGMMQRNEYTIIPRMEAYLSRLQAVDFTKTLYKDHHRLYITPSYQFKTTWMLDLFSFKIWYLIIVFYVLLTVISMLSQKIINDKSSQHLMSSTVDYFFYSFAALCNQGDVLYIVQKNFTSLSFCISMFSWFLITSFGSQLIIYMTQTVLIPPFTNLETLLDNTDYTILAEKYAIVYIAFKKNYRPIYTRINEADRVQFYDRYKEIWHLACSNQENYAVLQSELVKMGDGAPCTLVPTGEEYFKTWTVSGIAKDFIYKKSINIGILKLHEYGIINILKARWLNVKYTQNHLKRYYSPIALDQVSLVFCIYAFGVCLSIVIGIVEKIVFTLKSSKYEESKRNKR